jgi:hypothetical protein
MMMHRILRFMNNLQEFSENQIDWREEGSEEEIKENRIPSGLVPLEHFFDRHDRYKEKKEMD